MSQMATRILDVLGSKEYRPVVAADLAKILQITKRGMPEFRQALEQIASAGKIRVGKKGRIRLKSSFGLITGIVKKIGSGAAFVIPAEKIPELRGAILIYRPEMSVMLKQRRSARSPDSHSRTAVSGAGLLNRWLSEPAMSLLALILNEPGRALFGSMAVRLTSPFMWVTRGQGCAA